MKNRLSIISLSLLVSMSAMADDFTGKVVGIDGKPVANVVITSPGCRIARTETDGTFTFKGVKADAAITFKHDGYYNQVEHVRLSDSGKMMTVHLIPVTSTRYSEDGVNTVDRKDYALGSNTVEDAMRELPGLNVVSKSGMPGEGAYVSLRGIKSLVGESSPLYVINGVPYLPDNNESLVINGLSRSVFDALHGQDIKKITVLKSGETAIYGSMGSNGVILIETDQASKENMNTRISFNAMYGFNWNKSRMPLMNSMEYKSYLTDMGLTYYPNQEAFFKDFTFLTDPSANNAELYSYNTNWQDEVMRNSTQKDFLVRVEGGDNIAKYNISLGYTGNDGTIKNTGHDKYHAQINASVLVTKQFEILASINTAYLTGTYQEQGMSYETNPLLAAYRRSPLLSPYRNDIYGKLISTYSTYDYGALTNSDFHVSNPLAVVDGVDARMKQYDLNGKVQFVYRPVNELTINGVVGMYYNYAHENIFIPGKTDQAVKYLFDRFGRSDNTVRVGTNYTFNMYYGLNAEYKKVFSEKHALNASLGLNVTTTSYENDAEFGRNTTNDYLKNMSDMSDALGRYFAGYNNKWNWMDVYTHIDYTYDNLLRFGLTTSFDNSSSTNSVAFYPAFDSRIMLKRIPFFRNIDFLNKLDIYGTLSIIGNTRFNSKISQSYYTSTPYLTVAGIVPASLMTSEKLMEEKDYTGSVGIEAAFLNNRINLGFEYFHTRAYDVIVPGSPSAVLGTSSYYHNCGELSSRGIEAKVTAVPVIAKDFTWTLGFTAGTVNNKVNHLGGMDEIINTLPDGATIITRQGETPYAFYGLQTAGVYATADDANTAYTDADGNKKPMLNDKGVAYQAGDVRYVDQNGDGKINEKDKVVLGSGAANFYGSIFTRFNYRNFALDLAFGYQMGGKAYNAVRRVTESSLDFSNQSTAVLRRWSMEGQVTDMPKAEYGDPRGNNIFSDRWMEKTDFLKLRAVTLSYTYNKPLWNFLQGATIYVTGENLFTVTNYLGLDPEFAYSYNPMLQGVDMGKINAPRSVKMGVNLKF